MTDGTSLDDLDLRIISALQADGRASWTEIAEKAGSSLATVTRRGQQLFASGVVAVGVSPDLNTPVAAELFVLRIRCQAGSQMKVARGLALRQDLRFLCLVTGANDLIAEIAIPKTESLHRRLIDEVQAIHGVVSCRSDLVVHTHKVSQRWLQGGLARLERDDQISVAPHICDPSHFDDIDRRILEGLKLDGRASFRSVAETIGVNESTVRRRFEAMLQRGCAIVLTMVSAAAIGFEAEILLNISVAPAQLEQVAQQLGKYVGVRYLAATLDCALMCEVIMPSTPDVYAFLTQELGNIDGVLGWEASVELLTIKRGFIDTPWWRRTNGRDVAESSNIAIAEL